MSQDRHSMDTLENHLQRAASRIEQDWRKLSDDERMTLMMLCCKDCGTLKIPCYCGPEWDL